MRDRSRTQQIRRLHAGTPSGLVRFLRHHAGMVRHGSRLANGHAAEIHERQQQNVEAAWSCQRKEGSVAHMNAVVAQGRYSPGGSSSLVAFVPLLVLPTIAVCLRGVLADWMFMWVMALA